MDKHSRNLCAVIVLCFILVAGVYSIPTSRTVTFVNECADDYYLFVTSNAVGQSCTTQAECPAGRT